MKASPVIRRRNFGYYVLVGVAVGLALFIVVAVGLLFVRAFGSASAAPTPTPAPAAAPATAPSPPAAVVQAEPAAPVTSSAPVAPAKPAAARPGRSVKAPAQPFHGVVWPAEARGPKVVDPAAENETKEEMVEETAVPAEQDAKVEEPAGGAAETKAEEPSARKPGRLKRVFGALSRPFRGKK